MISINVDSDKLIQIFQSELRNKLTEIEHTLTFWDTKELKRRTCMSWGTIQGTFFHDEEFPKAKVGGKWYFPARETDEYLVKWLRRREVGS